MSAGAAGEDEREAIMAGLPARTEIQSPRGGLWIIPSAPGATGTQPCAARSRGTAVAEAAIVAAAFQIAYPHGRPAPRP